MLVIWFASGLTMMLLMAGMQGISHEVYESADLDGAVWWDKELRITLPMLRRTIALSLILSVIGSFLAFNQFYILTQGGPGTSTTTVVHVDLRAGFRRAASRCRDNAVAGVGRRGRLVSALQFFLLRAASD